MIHLKHRPLNMFLKNNHRSITKYCSDLPGMDAELELDCLSNSSSVPRTYFIYRVIIEKKKTEKKKNRKKQVLSRGPLQ